MSKLFKTTVEGEAFPHRELWNTATRQFEMARQQAKGAAHFDLAAILIGYLSYEAYLNLLVSELEPTVWANEKTFLSSSGKYPGAEGKLKWIQENISGLTVNKGERPYQTIRKVKNLRDKLSHGKPYNYADEAVHTEDSEPLSWPRGSFGEISEEFAKQAIQDLEEFMEYLHTHVHPKLRNLWLKAGALKGTTAYQTSETSVAN